MTAMSLYSESPEIGCKSRTGRVLVNNLIPRVFHLLVCFPLTTELGSGSTGWENMAIVTVQLGQCGNQIGHEFFDFITEDAGKVHSQFNSNLVDQKTCDEYEENSTSRFFSFNEKGQRTARSVMIDMESKVISQNLDQANKSGTWTYPKGQQFYQKRGSGNNWAYGFYTHGRHCEERVLEMVQREVEKCDRFDGFLVMLSVAGGTGSGVGASVTNALRDSFPHSFIVNQVVWPFGSGEVIVQNYNAILTLSQLYKSSDALIILENDQLQNICSKLLHLKHVSFRDINKVIAHKLASVFQPVKLFSVGSDASGAHTSKCQVSNMLGALVESLCPHTEYKLLNLKNIPHMPEKSLVYSSYSWSGLLKHLHQMLIANATMEEGIDWEVRLPTVSHPQRPTDHSYLGKKINKSIANLLILRGKDMHIADISSFKNHGLCPVCNSSNCACSVWCHSRPFNQYEKSATLLSNSQTPVASLTSVAQRAWDMFASRAYVHQYLRYGSTEDDFLDSFASVEQIIKNYSSI